MTYKKVIMTNYIPDEIKEELVRKYEKRTNFSKWAKEHNINHISLCRIKKRGTSYVLTKEEIDEVRNLKKYSISELSRDYNINYNTLYNFLKKNSGEIRLENFKLESKVRNMIA